MTSLVLAKHGWLARNPENKMSGSGFVCKSDSNLVNKSSRDEWNTAPKRVHIYVIIVVIVFSTRIIMIKLQSFQIFLWMTMTPSDWLFHGSVFKCSNVPMSGILATDMLLIPAPMCQCVTRRLFERCWHLGPDALSEKGQVTLRILVVNKGVWNIIQLESCRYNYSHMNQGPYSAYRCKSFI